MVSPVLYIIVCPWLYAYLDACVCVCVCACVCVCVCVCVFVQGEEDAGIRGIVQYVTFSIDVSFCRCKIDCVNYKKHS